MRPYLKFIIIGGIFTGEGGGSLMAGLMFNMEAAMFQSTLGSAVGILTMMVMPFIIIGLVSLPIGLSFLITGAVKRKAWFAENTFG